MKSHYPYRPGPYLPHTADDIDRMLERCGVSSIDDLYADVPEQLRLKHPYALPDGRSEYEVRRYFEALCDKNRTLACFAGAGWYDHDCPAVVSELLKRSEFLTAYTPYQPEISQGTLQYIFEYQTMMARLTGMEVSNASMYDGATATAEAMMMAVAASRKRRRVLVAATLLPFVRAVIDTYARYHGVEITTIPETTDSGHNSEPGGICDKDALAEELKKGDVAGVIAAYPNRYGILEDLTGWADEIHAAKALFVVNTHASALGIVRPQGEWGADIAVGEAQSLGMPLNYGGPGLGYMCTSKALIRKMPGRIVGATADADGQRSFVLTLQAREQHIRRDKATSNICSNQGIMTLHAAIYLSLLGPDGLLKVNEAGAKGLRHLVRNLESTGRMHESRNLPCLNETVMTADFDIDELIRRGTEQGLLCGVKIDDRHIMIAVTEKQTDEEMDRYVNLVKSLPTP